jgi:tetratricopeptide (TPR) repeat protein
MSDATDQRDPVDLLAEEFAARLRAGESPSLDEYLDRCPEHAASIRAVFRSITLVERISQQEYAERRFERRPKHPSGEHPGTLGDFQILREVGRGGMGIVYEAVQTSLNRRVALKLLGPHVAGSPTQLQRFRREAKAVAQLHHTNIVPVYGVGEEEGLHFYAMQFIEGDSLAAAIRGTPAHGARDWRGVAHIVAQIADALCYAHRHGVLHRDIKPSNLLLDREGGIWITDFGLAKQEDQEGLTDVGDLLGTLRYMAPEQFDGHTDALSDIYSLGLTLFELLTLRPAYAESQHGPLIKAKTREAPPRPRALDRRIPADLETITLKCCATEPADRYQGAEELADDLRRFLEDRPIRARRARAPERLRRWCRRNPVVAALGSVTFLLLLTVAIVFAVGNYRTRQALTSLARERNRAETNLALAIRAFERIIGDISARGMARPPGLELGDAESVGPETVLTAADAALLKTLLAFFDRLANENGADLKGVAASARKRVGDIQQRLGRFVEAEATYREALDAYTALADQERGAERWIVARATILNEMGVTAGRRGAFMAAWDYHDAARLLLERSAPALESNAGRLERARTLILLCSIASRNGVEGLFASLRADWSWRSAPPPPDGAGGGGRGAGPGWTRRPGPGPGGSPFPNEHRGQWKTTIQQAIGLIRGLLAEQPANPEYRLYLARACREEVRIARLGHDRALAEQSLRTAIEDLEQLVTDFPTDPGYQSALAEMLCTPLEFPGDSKPNAETLERSARAAALAQKLLAAYPQVPEQRILSGTVLSRLAWLQNASGDPAQACETYRQAIALEESLSEEFPSLLQSAIALAEALKQLADVEFAQGRPEEAAGHLDAAIARLERFPKGNAARFLPPMIHRLRERRAAIPTDLRRGDPEGQEQTKGT